MTIENKEYNPENLIVARDRFEELNEYAQTLAEDPIDVDAIKDRISEVYINSLEVYETRKEERLERGLSA